MGKTQKKRKINKSFRITKRIRGGKPTPDPAMIRHLQKKLNDKKRAEDDKQMAERAAIIDQMNAAPVVEQSGWFWWLPKTQTQKKLAMEAEAKKEEERKQLIAAELKAIEEEKERKAMEEKAELEKASKKKDKRNRQKEIAQAKSKAEAEAKSKAEAEAKSKAEAEVIVSVDKEVPIPTIVSSIVLPPPPPPPKKQKPKRTINIENITLFTEARLKKLKALTVSAEDLTTNETTNVTKYTDTDTDEKLEYPTRNVFYEPNDPNTIVKYGNEVFDPANSVLKSILRKMFVLYGAISTQLYATKSPYQLVMKGTRALYLNNEASGKTLITSDIDVSIIRRSNQVEDPETSYEIRKKLAEYIGSLITTLCKGDGYIIDSSIPIQNQNIVKITYRNPSSGERIGLSDIAITQENTIGESPNPAVDLYGYIRMTLLIQGIYVTFLYPTVYNMKLEKELYLEHYTVENNARGLESITNGLNKIKYVLGDVAYETTEGKQIVERALEERERRLIDAEKVKSGKLTREELQELINSKRKK